MLAAKGDAEGVFRANQDLGGDLERLIEMLKRVDAGEPAMEASDGG